MRRIIYISLAAALLLAGCGDVKPSASAGGSASHDPANTAYRYADCMRQHGVSNFPDPVITHQAGGTSLRMVVSAGIASEPAWKPAQKACASLMPGPPSPAQAAQQNHQRMLGLLSFASCVRAHGLNNFPDPNAQGQITQETLASAGIDVHSPSVLRVATECVGASHGFVTRAAIAQAVNRGG